MMNVTLNLLLPLFALLLPRGQFSILNNSFFNENWNSSWKVLLNYRFQTCFDRNLDSYIEIEKVIGVY